MAEENKNKIKDLDRLVADAKLKALKTKGEWGELVKTDLKTKLSSTVGVEDRGAEGPKKLPKIRTYSYDAKKAVEDSNASGTRIRVSQDKQKRTGRKIEGKGIFALVALVLIVLGIGGVYMIFMNQEPEAAPESIIVERNAILDYDQIIESTNDSFPEMFSQISTSNGITYIFNESVDIRNLSHEYLQNIPGILSRNLSNEYMYGAVSTDVVNVPFLILKSSYKFALPGMQQWEGNISEDLSELLFLAETPKDIFLDVPHPTEIIRTDGSVVYAATKSGYIILSRDVDVVNRIIFELLVDLE